MRLEDWEDRLAVYLARVETEPFAWGTHDCALFAASCVEAMTGVDPAVDFRGAYQSKAGAAKALREIGNGTLLKTYQARFREKPAGFAGRGDLVWNGEAMGICIGAEALFLGEPDGAPGYIRLPRAEWVTGFDTWEK